MKKEDLSQFLTTVSEVKEKETEWVIPRWIAKGGITLLVGDGGIGKTNLWCYLISRISGGLSTMLDDPDYERETHPGHAATIDYTNKILYETGPNRSCIYFSKEDSTSTRLKESLEPTQRDDFDEASVTAWSKESEWLGIEIKQTKTEEEKNIGWVEFIARFKQGNITRNHHELGEFHKVGGAWFFYDGRAVKQETVRHEGPVVGRNDPCPCGSGKKYKKCCGAGK